MERKARCAVHGKLRSVDCLVETGAGLVCSSRTQCKDGGGDRDQLCRFFARGECEKGDDCQYKHDEEDVPPSAAGKGRSHAIGKGRDTRDACKGKGGKMSRGMPGKSAGYGCMDAWGDDGYGCMDSWGKGKGKDAWDMSYGCMDYWGGEVYGMDPWGADSWGYDPYGCGCMGKMGKGMGKDSMMCWQPSIGPAKGKRKGLAKGDDMMLDERKDTCAEHGKLRSVDCLEDAGDGTLVCKPEFACQNAGEGGVKRAFCKFFAQGACERGLGCAFAHTDWDIGTSTEATPTEKGGKSKGKSKGKMWGGAYSIDGDEGRAVCIEHGKQRSTTCMLASPDGWRCKPGKECSSAVAGPKRAMCKFFQEGRCDRGDACVFAHDEAEIGQMNTDAPDEIYEALRKVDDDGGDPDDEGQYGRRYDATRGRQGPYTRRNNLR